MARYVCGRHIRLASMSSKCWPWIFLKVVSIRYHLHCTVHWNESVHTNQNKPNQGCFNQHHHTQFEALTCVHVVPARFTNQSSERYGYLSCYVAFKSCFQNIKGCMPYNVFCRYCDCAIRFVHDTNRASWMKISGTWIHIHVIIRVQGDCVFPFPLEQ